MTKTEKRSLRLVSRGHGLVGLLLGSAKGLSTGVTWAHLHL